MASANVVTVTDANFASEVQNATVPVVVARQILELHPHLDTRTLPFELEGTPMEMLWPVAGDQDPASAFLREQVGLLCRELGRA